MRDAVSKKQVEGKKEGPKKNWAGGGSHPALKKMCRLQKSTRGTLGGEGKPSKGIRQGMSRGPGVSTWGGAKQKAGESKESGDRA